MALITAFHDPVLRHDLDVFARHNGLPTPDLHVIPVGHPATADPANFEQAISVQEGTLDAEAVLAMAPRVRLDYIETQQDVGATPASLSGAMDVLGHVLPRLRPRVDAVRFSYGWFEENDAEATGNWAGARALIRQQQPVWPPPCGTASPSYRPTATPAPPAPTSPEPVPILPDYAVTCRLSRWCSKDRQMTCWAFSILDRGHGLFARGQGHYGG